MLPAYKGRINRKTFILGNAVGLAILGFAGLIYIVPLAIMDIVISGSDSSPVFRFLYTLFLVPVAFYFFYFTVLFVKRLHDVGYPGMLILWAFVGLMLVAQAANLWWLNFIGVLILLAVCILPGQKDRNSFGPKPTRRFKLSDLVVRF